MTLNIQFHATPQEIESLVLKWVSADGVSAAEVRRRPFAVQEADAASLSGRIAHGEVEWIALRTRPLEFRVKNSYEFLEQNPDVLNVEIGKLTGDSLGESGLNSLAEGPTLLRWNQLAKALKAVTKAGALAVNPKTGASSRARNHRYSQGALELERRGIKMTPIGGFVIYRFSEG